jgi:hypothetical protein
LETSIHEEAVMIRIQKTIGATLMGLAVMAASPTYTQAADMAAQIQSAKTAADHEAIAKEYDAQAAAATQSAATHRKMAETYKGMAATSGGKGAGISAMPQHCESLAKGFDAEADQYKAMAQTHRDVAKGM